MLNKILIVIFITLFSTIIIEVGYLFFYSAPHGQVNSGTTTSNTLKEGVSNAPIVFLSRFDHSILTSAIISADFEGRIAKVMDKPGTGESGIPYEKGLTLQPISPSTNYAGNQLLFRKADMPVLKVFDTLLFIKREISFSSLKKGDNVNVEMKIDLKKDTRYNRLEIKILKI